MTKNLLYLTIIFLLIFGKVNSQNLPIEKYQNYFNLSILKFKLTYDTSLIHKAILKTLPKKDLNFKINGFKEKNKTDSSLYRLCKELIRENETIEVKDDSAYIVDYFSKILLNGKSYPEIYKISTLNSSQFNRMKSEIIDYIKTDIQSVRQDFLKTGKENHKFEGFNSFNYIIGILILLIVFCMVLLVFKYDKSLKILNAEINKINANTKHNSLTRNEIETIRMDLSKKRDIENQHSNSKYSSKEFRYPLNEDNPNPERIKETNIQTSQPIIHKPEHTKYYFSTPNDDGSFLDRNKATEFEQYSKFFLFKIDNNIPNIAYVTIVDDSETQKHILNNYKEYLDAVCNYKNPFFQNANKIITLKPGKAYLEGDRWIIKESDKLIISFQ